MRKIVSSKVNRVQVNALSFLRKRVRNLGFEKSQCKTSKCFKNIDGCSLDDSQCAIVTTKMNAAKNGLEISLIHSGSDTYVAVGITNSKAMRNIDIYYCQNRGKSLKIVALKYQSFRVCSTLLGLYRCR